MTNHGGVTAIDEELTAFLDGELDARARADLERRLASDPDFRARLERLAAGAIVTRAPFDVLLQAAPMARLQAMLQTADRPQRATLVTRRRFALAAAALLLLAAGAGIGFTIARLTPQEVVEAHSWREAVAEYLTLYTADTLALIPEDASLRQDELSAIGQRLGLSLSPTAVDLADLTLKRAQLFEFEGKPLAQIAYLTPQSGPVAFCIIVNGGPDRPPTFEARDGQNVVYWQKQGRGYMVIGKLPRADMEAIAAVLDRRVS